MPPASQHASLALQEHFQTQQGAQAAPLALPALRLIGPTLPLMGWTIISGISRQSTLSNHPTAFLVSLDPTSLCHRKLNAFHASQGPSLISQDCQLVDSAPMDMVPPALAHQHVPSAPRGLMPTLRPAVSAKGALLESSRHQGQKSARLALRGRSLISEMPPAHLA